MFDIETTGLSFSRSHLTVIGAGYPEGDCFKVVQFFLEKPSDEKELLIEFSEFLSDFDKIIHFNGSTFDIPYIKKKCLNYELPDPFESKEAIDLYRIAGRFDKILGLDGINQKSIEAKCNIQRSDTISGAECVEVYEKYIVSGNQEYKNKLLLHNEDDILGLYKLQSFYSYALLQEPGSIDLISSEITTLPPEDKDRSETSTSFFRDFESSTAHYHKLTFKIKAKIPLPIESSGINYFLHISGSHGVLYLKGQKTEKKYFFKNFKDYFYLPIEDKAIHKSVGIYVDKENRKKATRDNCYEKHTDIFFPQPKSVIIPVFKESSADKLFWYQEKSVLKAPEKAFISLIEACIKYAIKASKSTKIPFEL